MGASNSVPLWMNPNQTPEGYDQWGAVGTMQQPPQYDWSELHQKGFPDTSAFSANYLKNPKKYQNEGTTTLWVGQTNDRLNVWGGGHSVFQPSTNGLQENGQDHGFYPVHTDPFPGKNLPTPWQPSSKTCTPHTFPACDMTDFASATDGVQQWPEWWAGTNVNPVITNGKTWVPPGTKGKVMNPSPVEIYTDAIDRGVNSYATGKYIGLEQLNSQDTSGYDPCSGDSLVEQILPVILGSVGLVIVRVYGAEIFAFLPETSKGYLEATAFLTLYFTGKAVVDSTKVVTDNDGGEATSIDIDNASRALAIGLGLTLSGPVSQIDYLANVPLVVTTGAMGFLGNALSPLARYAIVPAVTSGSILLFLPMLIMRVVDRFFCRVSSSGENACDDFGENAGGTDAGFEDVRRWDVFSISARLTDLFCEDKGIPRDSEQAKFVFRTLSTNPSWMSAATTTEENLWTEQKVNLNPLGLLVAIEETGETSAASNNYAPKNPVEWKQNWADQRYGFTGTTKDAMDPVSAQNYFACQNFDILFNADDCFNPSNPNIHKDKPECAEKNPDNAEDVALAKKLKEWLAAASEASDDPTNWYKQFTVPGLSNTYNKHQGDLPPVAKFLENAHKDRIKGDMGLGFDNVQDRGEFAGLYTNKSHPAAAGADWMACKATQLFKQFDTMEEAWQYVLSTPKVYVKQNKIALVHLWFREDMGEDQKISRHTWQNGYEEPEKFYLEHPDPKNFVLETGMLPTVPYLNPDLPFDMKPLPFDMKPLPFLTKGQAFLVSLKNAYAASMQAASPQPLMKEFDQNNLSEWTVPSIPPWSNFNILQRIEVMLYVQMTHAMFDNQGVQFDTTSMYDDVVQYLLFPPPGVSQEIWSTYFCGSNFESGPMDEWYSKMSAHGQADLKKTFQC